MRESLLRILIFLGIVGLLVFVVQSLARWQNQSKIAGESISLPIIPVKEKLEEFGEDVLGKAVSILPGAPDLGVNQETEPIEEPMENVQKYTEALIEALKKLPEDQLEATKKQIRKEFCEGVLGEE